MNHVIQQLKMISVDNDIKRTCPKYGAPMCEGGGD